MSTDISIRKKLILRSGKTYDLGTVECPAEPKCGELWYQTECLFLGDYAQEHLHKIKSAYSNDCGVWELPLSAVQDIISRCNKALGTRDKSTLRSLFPIGSCGKRRYDGYDDNFFRDISFCLRTLPVVLSDLGDPDVIFEISVY